MSEKISTKNQFKVRDLRQKGKFVIDDVYLDSYAKILGVTVSAVYISLCRHVDKDQECFPSQELIAKEHNLTDRTVRTAIRKLREANIINIQRDRTGKGKWLNNTYVLLDQSQWKAPKELDCLWSSRGKNQPKPEENNDQARGSQIPTKETHKKETHIKDNNILAKANILATQGVVMKDSIKLNPLIALFKTVNPNYEKLFSNKTQRQALERLVRKFGKEKIEEMITALPGIIKRPYAPRITTPLQLENRLADLIVFIQQERSKKDKYVIGVV